MGSMQWDLFCRVVDNFGDIGVCWRLAADLATRGEQVRLWVDDASALRWMAPAGAPGVHVMRWPASDAGVDPGDVVIEAFGCELPMPFVERMARRTRAPVWINLEYLSAEAFVERAHRLPSPQQGGPGAGLTKHFFYPGFTPRTGGLIREPDLAARQRAFDGSAWLAAHGAAVADGEQVVSLFCYENGALPALLDQLALRPTLLLATTGAAAHQVTALLGPGLKRGALRALTLPPLSQRDYDHLLWASELNFVRGEDSFVRAQWAARPFVWQIYPQHDAAHIAKLDAFLARFLAGADAPWRAGLQRFWHAWNGAGPALPALPARAPWVEHAVRWRDSLRAQTDLVTQLLGFVAETR
ncbi:MAG TPA: elongation factor P maturation arginine rhamnosyltransferase EarP [Burkholderiaceae bacterium]|nr:elongation factor P maturation arginine rhamnosyltransferase EarP [Burkholderiaceae bacterium]